jgi:hypothetical protein
MKKRGKVLRDTCSGPGLLMMDGRQYRYVLEGVWKSEIQPKPGLVVDVELDASGNVQSVTVVDEAQLGREEAALAMAKVRRSRAAEQPKRISLPHLAAAGLLAVGWFILPAVSVQIPFPGRLDITFWQILEFLNAGGVPEFLDARGTSGAGFYGATALLACTGPFVHRVWKKPRARFGGLLPLVFMIVIGFLFRSSIVNAVGRVISLGIGSYLSALVCLYFAFESVRVFLLSRSENVQTEELTQRKRKAA